MTPVAVAYMVGALGMLVGVGIGVRLLSVTDVDSRAGAFRYLLVIPGAAAVMYGLMAVGVGTITVHGATVPAPRYVDWLLTTPVLVGYVAYTAGAPKRATASIVSADAAMIGIGWVAVVTSGPIRFAAFTVSSACYVGLLWALYSYLPTFVNRQNTGRQHLFELLRNHVGLLWLAYPIIWLAGPLGVGLVSMLSVSLVITYIDVVAKVPYVYFVYQHRHAFADDRFADATDGRRTQVSQLAD
ncbi:bacteriorhodopsin [Salinigranum halophilum]|uniref:bacteriorhodopsin n=1 Tax=Salinigranum halophilum TaxID=2565931 RepID=UPI0010A80D78|nr:bacteriorhodopsin [Salinigranum halophilum]